MVLFLVNLIVLGLSAKVNTFQEWFCEHMRSRATEAEQRPRAPGALEPLDELVKVVGGDGPVGEVALRDLSKVKTPDLLAKGLVLDHAQSIRVLLEGMRNTHKFAVG